MLQHKAKVEEGQDHEAFVEALWRALQSCLPETHGALMYPLQLLTGNVPLATILEMVATTQLQAVTGKELMPAVPTPSAVASKMPAP